MSLCRDRHFCPLLLTSRFFLFFSICSLGTLGVLPQTTRVPPALHSPGSAPGQRQESARGKERHRKGSCAQGLPVNIQPFAPIYSGSTDIGFVFSKPCQVFQCIWKNERVKAINNLWTQSCWHNSHATANLMGQSPFFFFFLKLPGSWWARLPR